MIVRDKYEGCDPLVKTVLLNGQEVLCYAETVESIILNGERGTGPVKVWITDYKMDERDNRRYYYDCNVIAYKKAVVID